MFDTLVAASSALQQFTIESSLRQSSDAVHWRPLLLLSRHKNHNAIRPVIPSLKTWKETKPQEKPRNTAINIQPVSLEDALEMPALLQNPN